MLTKQVVNDKMQYIFSEIPTTDISAYHAIIILNGSDVHYLRNTSASYSYKITASCLKNGVFTYLDLPNNTTDMDVSGYDYVMVGAYASGLKFRIIR